MAVSSGISTWIVVGSEAIARTPRPHPRGQPPEMFQELDVPFKEGNALLEVVF